MMFGTFAEVRPHLDSGRLRVIGVTSARRWDRFPDAPTFAESVAPGFEARGWQAMAAPGGMAPALVKQIEATLHKVLASARALRATLGRTPSKAEIATHCGLSEHDVHLTLELVKIMQR
jgi:tripartite-type tricarboxylate transporter receptor subunit TctC